MHMPCPCPWKLVCSMFAFLDIQDRHLTHSSYTGKQSIENTVTKCFLSVETAKDHGGIRVGFNSWQRETADRWRSAANPHYFGVMAMDVEMVKQYLSDPSNEARLNALQNWLSMDYLYKKIKTILLLSFLSG